MTGSSPEDTAYVVTTARPDDIHGPTTGYAGLRRWPTLEAATEMRDYALRSEFPHARIIPVPAAAPGDPAPPSDGYTDAAGVLHQVDITTARHDYWTAASELLASRLCGWWDHHTYQPGGRDYADMKLRFRASDHVDPERART